jgi:tRNA threonylcarbamoyladenosine biosynthesis protein TsaE
MKKISRSLKDTAHIAEEVLKKIKKMRSSGARVITLQGDLGAGKTAFAKLFLKSLGVKKRIVSPTFVLLKRYPLTKKENAYHMDAYRIKKIEECDALGLKEIFADTHALILIEWPERIKKIIPKKKFTIRFTHGKKENERSIHTKIS